MSRETSQSQTNWNSQSPQQASTQGQGLPAWNHVPGLRFPKSSQVVSSPYFCSSGVTRASHNSRHGSGNADSGGGEWGVRTGREPDVSVATAPGSQGLLLWLAILGAHLGKFIKNCHCSPNHETYVYFSENQCRVKCCPTINKQILMKIHSNYKK